MEVMEDKVEFDRWYEKPLAYCFTRWPEDRGTSAKIRGTSKQILRFIRFLQVEYCPDITFPDAIVRDRLEQVIQGNPRREELICFGDDRIRRVTKISQDYLEIEHTEQYGDTEGRKLMIEKVLRTLEHMS